MIISNETYKKIKKLAEQECWGDHLSDVEDTIVDDFAGGDIDYAYQGGMRSGETLLAREIQEAILKDTNDFL